MVDERGEHGGLSHGSVGPDPAGPGPADESAGQSRALPGRITPPQGPPTTLLYRLRTIHLPLILIGLGLFAAMVLVAIDRWRRGTVLFGLVTLVAAVLRLVLPPERVGVLAVRSRWFDVATLALLGAAIVWLGVSVDPLGTG